MNFTCNAKIDGTIPDKGAEYFRSTAVSCLCIVSDKILQHELHVAERLGEVRRDS